MNFIVLGIFFSYLAYYFFFVQRKPVLVYTQTQANRAIVSACPSLHRAYRPPLWAINCHVQILWIFLRDFFDRSAGFYDDETRLLAPDGGHISIEWYGLQRQGGERPILLMFPTICGSGEDLKRHVKYMHQRLGWTVAVCNRRGHSRLPLAVPKINLLGCLDDLDLQLDAVQARFPKAPLYGYGLSAGSALLVRYLGRKGSDSRILAAVANSPGYNTELAFRRFSKPYDYIMTRRLKRYFLQRHKKTLSQHASFQPCLDAANVDELHQRTYGLAGYRSVRDFFQDSNPMNEAHRIVTPLMIVNAKDDPVCVSKNIEEHLPLLRELPHVILAMTQRGSHCAFFEGWLGLYSWADRLAAEFLTAQNRQSFEGQERA